MRRPSVGCHTSYREGGQGHEVFPEKFFPRSLEPLLRGGRTCTSTPGTWASGHSSVCAAGHLRTCVRAPPGTHISRGRTRCHEIAPTRPRSHPADPGRTDTPGHGLNRRAAADTCDLVTTGTTSRSDVRPRHRRGEVWDRPELRSGPRLTWPPETREPPHDVAPSRPRSCDLAGSRPRRASSGRSSDQPGPGRFSRRRRAGGAGW
jgi:hypothetical protein